MNYWVLKGRRNRNVWDDMLGPGNTDVWETKRPPSSWQTADRLFCWESSPKLRVVGLAELSNPRLRIDKTGSTHFTVTYLSNALASKPTINELRAIPVIGSASFLKSGPARCVQALPHEQAELLVRLIHYRNPELNVVWNDVDLNSCGSIIPDIDLRTARWEGNKKLVSHLIRERDQRLVAIKKEATMNSSGRLSCEICSFNFEDVYGPRGRDFCEVHHVQPLSELDSERERLSLKILPLFVQTVIGCYIAPPGSIWTS